MARKKLVQKNKYFYWCTEKYGKEVYWHKTNWQSHVDRHEKILKEQQIFIDALVNPDRVYPNSIYSNCTSYYKVGAFSNGSDTPDHAQVIVIEDNNITPRPSNKPFLIVTTAMDRPDIPEEGKKNPKFIKQK